MELTQLSKERLESLVKEAKHYIYLSTQAFSADLTDAVDKALASGVMVNLVVDYNEDNFRNGLISVKANELFKNETIKCYDRQANRVGFLFTERCNYLLFQQSLYTEMDVKSDGLNAISISKTEAVSILKGLEVSFEDFNYNYSKGTKPLSIFNLLSSQKIETSKLKEVTKNIAASVPQAPNEHNLVTVFNAHFGFAKLSVTTSKLKYEKVEIPKELLKKAVGDQYAKEATGTFNLFDETFDKNFNYRNTIIKDCENFRSKYFTKIASRELSLYNKSLVETIKTEIDNLNTSLKVENKKLQKFLLEKESKIIEAAITSFKKSNEDLAPFVVRNLGIMLRKSVESSITSLSKKLDIDPIKMEVYDITWSDINDESFREQLVEKKLILSTNLDETALINLARIINPALIRV